MNKYELVDVEGGLHRIRALRDIDTGYIDVRAGELGGLVSGEHNLSQDGGCWLFDDAKVINDARVDEYAHVAGLSMISGNARVSGSALVRSSRVAKNAQVYQNAQVFDQSLVTGEARVYGYASVSESSLRDESHIYGSASVYGSQLYDNARVVGHCYITNAHLWESALVEEDHHAVTLYGILHWPITVYRTGDKGHKISVGCQLFTLDNLRKDEWQDHDVQRGDIPSGLLTLVKSIVNRWAKE